MLKIEVGDIVKKKACKNTGPEAWVTVLEKEEPEGRLGLIRYTVLQPDGSVAQYTDVVLKKQRTVYA